MKFKIGDKVRDVANPHSPVYTVTGVKLEDKCGVEFRDMKLRGQSIGGLTNMGWGHRPERFELAEEPVPKPPEKYHIILGDAVKTVNTRNEVYDFFYTEFTAKDADYGQKLRVIKGQVFEVNIKVTKKVTLTEA